MAEILEGIENLAGGGPEHEAAYHERMERLRAEMARLRGEMNNVMGSLRGVGSSGAGAARERLQMEIERGMEQLNELYACVRGESQRAAKTVKSTVEERPVTSLLVALGVGVLVGKLLSRR